MKKITKMKKFFLMKIVLGGLVIAITGCGIQSIPRAHNQVEASLAEMTNQYKRRADLVPQLVGTVRGFAAQEEKVLTQVVEARAKATQVQMDASSLTPEKMQSFQRAQGELGAALGRLMVVVEQYPQLKSDAHFLDLQAQLEGTENRITIARQRHIEAIREFNNLVTVFPTSLTNSLLFHHPKMPQWTTENAADLSKPPEVKF